MFVRSLRCAISLGVSLFSVALWAKTTTLTVVDGQKWSAGTWDNGLPEDGDIVVVNNGTGAAATTVNDLVTSLTRIDFSGAEITLGGNNLSLAGDKATQTDRFATALQTTAKLTVDVELTATDSSCWYCNGASSKESGFKQDVYIADGKTLLMKTSWDATGCYFSKRIVGPRATLDPRAYHTTLNFNGPIDIGTLDCKSQGNYTALNFNAAGNKVGTFVNYGDNLNMAVANAFAAPLLLKHDTVMDNQASYQFAGKHVLEGFSGPDTVNRGFRVHSYYTDAALLTLKPTADYSAAVQLGYSDPTKTYNQLSIVYAPEGDFTQTIIGRNHTMPGTLRIQNGTMRFTGDTQFSELLSLTVEGGTFATASTSASVQFAKLATLAIGTAGTFLVEDDCTATVFDSAVTDLVLTPGAKISIPAGKALSFKSASFGGAQLAPDTYTKATASWIDGDGSVVIAAPAANANYWAEAVDGTWTDADKWTKAAAPLSSDTACLTAAGADYAVALPAGVATPASVCVRNDGVHTTAIAPADGLTLSGWNLSLGWGGALVVPADSTLTLASTPVTLDDGGRMTVGKGTTASIGGAVKLRERASFESAGVLDLRAGLKAGTFNSDYPLSVVTSTVTIAGGQVNLNGGGIEIGKSARLVVSNDAVIVGKTAGNSIVAGGGEIVFRDHAAYDSGVAWCSVFATQTLPGGTVVFEDDAKWTSHLDSGSSRIALGSSGTSPATIVFRDRAYYDILGATEFRFTAGNVVLRYDSDATSHMKCGCEMCSQGGDHEIYVTKGLLVYGTSSTSDGSIRIGGVGTTRGDSTGTALYCVDGGAVEVWGSRWAHQFGTSGITVGDGNYSDADVNRTPSVKGTLEIRSGAITNKQGKIYVGIARSLGMVVQTGGEFISEEASAEAKCPVSIGACNGTGVFTLSNGVFSAKSNVFVGGTPLSEIGISTVSPYKDATRAAMYPKLHDANGELTVAAADLTKPCSFTTEKDLSFGADGNGVLRLGEAGSVTAANVTFWNGATDVTNHSSKVFCTLGASDAACLTATNAVTVQPGTKLTVDATKFAGDKKVWLVKAVEMKGTFDATIVGGKGTDSIVQTSKGVVFKRSHGLVILVR